jgi:HEAT repeat protein
MEFDQHEQQTKEFRQAETSNRDDRSSPDTAPSVLAYLGLSQVAAVQDIQEEQMASALESQDWTVRVATVRKLAKLNGQATVELLSMALRDEHQAVRVAAARSLGMLKVEISNTPLVAALQDPSWQVRTAAVIALGKQSTLAPVEPLMTMLDDEDASVRAAAVWAVGELGIRASDAPLITALHDTSWTVREAAARALGKLGTRVSPEPLREALHDSDEEVREAAAWALRQVQIDPLPLREQQVAQEEENEKVEPLHVRRLAVPARRRFLRRGIEGALVAGLVAAIGLSWLLVSYWPGSTMTGSGAGASGATVFQYQVPEGAITSVVWASPLTAHGGKNLVAFATSNGWVQVWNTATDQLVTTYGPFQKVLAMNWPASGLQIAALTSNGTLQLMQGVNIQNIQPVLTLHSTPSALVAWSPDGKRVAITTQASGQSAVMVWTLATHSSLVVHPSQSGEITSLAWASDNTELAAASDNGEMRNIDIWSTTQGIPVAHTMPVPFVPVPFRVLNMAWSSDGIHLAYALDDGEVRVWDRGTYNHLLLHSTTTDQSSSLSSTGATWSPVIAWSPDGKRVATTTSRGAIQVWDATTGDLLLTYQDHHQQINALTWSADGSRIASAGVDGLVLVWKEA